MDWLSKGLDLVEKHGPLLVFCAILVATCIYIFRALMQMADGRIRDHKEAQPILLELKASNDLLAELLRNLTSEVRSRQ